MSTRTPKPSAAKRSKVVAPIDNAQRVVRRILSVDQAETTEQNNWETSGGVIGLDASGTERPVPEWAEMNQSLFRAFAFLDLSGFTSYMENNGPKEATEMLARFRNVCRHVSVRRGARIAKWLGDGVMLVGTRPGPIVATVGEVLLRFGDDPFDVHAGIAAGTVLLFEGDDYIGPPVNAAARLCDAAGPGEALAAGVDAFIPDWIDRVGNLTVRADGLGTLTDVAQLKVPKDAWGEPSDGDRTLHLNGAPESLGA